MRAAFRKRDEDADVVDDIAPPVKRAAPAARAVSKRTVQFDEDDEGPPTVLPSTRMQPALVMRPAASALAAAPAHQQPRAPAVVPPAAAAGGSREEELAADAELVERAARARASRAAARVTAHASHALPLASHGRTMTAGDEDADLGLDEGPYEPTRAHALAGSEARPSHGNGSDRVGRLPPAPFHPAGAAGGHTGSSAAVLEMLEAEAARAQVDAAQASASSASVGAAAAAAATSLTADRAREGEAASSFDFWSKLRGEVGRAAAALSAHAGVPTTAAVERAARASRLSAALCSLDALHGSTPAGSARASVLLREVTQLAAEGMGKAVQVEVAAAVSVLRSRAGPPTLSPAQHGALQRLAGGGAEGQTAALEALEAGDWPAPALTAALRAWLTDGSSRALSVLPPAAASAASLTALFTAWKASPTHGQAYVDSFAYLSAADLLGVHARFQAQGWGLGGRLEDLEFFTPVWAFGEVPAPPPAFAADGALLRALVLAHVPPRLTAVVAGQYAPSSLSSTRALVEGLRDLLSFEPGPEALAPLATAVVGALEAGVAEAALATPVAAGRDGPTAAALARALLLVHSIAAWGDLLAAPVLCNLLLDAALPLLLPLLEAWGGDEAAALAACVVSAAAGPAGGQAVVEAHREGRRLVALARGAKRA